MATPAGDDAVQGGDGGIGVNRVGDEVAERLSGVLVGDVEDLDGPAGCRDVELVVEGPDVVRVGGKEPVRRRGRGAQPVETGHDVHFHEAPCDRPSVSLWVRREGCPEPGFERLELYLRRSINLNSRFRRKHRPALSIPLFRAKESRRVVVTTRRR